MTRSSPKSQTSRDTVSTDTTSIRQRSPSGPSASGARIGGDDVQHLIAWYYWLKACTPGSGIAAVAVEAADSATVDDVVIHYYSDAKRRWLQCKASVTVGFGPLDTKWLLATPTGIALDPNTKTLLRQLFRSWKQLGRPTEGIELVTTRNPQHGDLLIECIDHTNRIGPRLRIATDRSEIGKIRARLVDHLASTVEEVHEFFDALRVSAGQREVDWREKVNDVAAAAGVDRGITSQAVGLAAVREWVKTSRDPRSVDQLQKRLKDLGLHVRESRAHVVVETLSPFVGGEDAAVRISWLDQFKGDRPENWRGLV